jgi:hypothetical protein
MCDLPHAEFGFLFIPVVTFRALPLGQNFGKMMVRDPRQMRKRLFLVLLDKEVFDYVCTRCGSVAGKKEQPWRRPAHWSRI